MKQTILALFCIVAQTHAFSQANDKQPAPQIKQFWFVMLTKGTNRSHDSATAAKNDRMGTWPISNALLPKEN